MPVDPIKNTFLETFLASSHFLYACLLAPLILCFPSLFVGLVGDDYYHKAILTNSLPYQSSPLMDLFTFFSGEEGQNQYLIDIGVLPWWSDVQIHASFMRPISAMTHVIDYKLWPDILILHHLHSIFWMGGCIWMTYRLFILLLPKSNIWVPSLALLVFAVEDAHVITTSWLANRNSCVAFFFALLCLTHHIYWHKANKLNPFTLYKSQFYFVLALLSGESGICIWGYIILYNYIFDEKISYKSQILANIPYIFWIVLWRLLYLKMGFGTLGSSLYIDPLQSPLLFLEEFLFRGPLLFTSMYLQFPTEIGLLIPSIGKGFLGFCCILFFFFFARWVSFQHNKQLSFFFWSSTLSIIPLCGAFPMERLLLFPSLGFAATISLIIQMNFANWIKKTLLLIHIPVAVVFHIFKGGNLFLMHYIFSIGYQSVPKEIQTQQSIFFINGMELPCAYTTILSFDHDRNFHSISMLSSSSKKSVLTRLSDTDFTLSYDEGMFEGTFDRMTLNSNQVFQPNAVIERENFSVTILDTIDEEPNLVQFHIPKGIDHPDFIWLYQDGLTFLPFSFPPINQSVIIDPFFTTFFENDL